MPSEGGNRSRRGAVLGTLTEDIWSTETSVGWGSAPCNEKLELLSDCMPGRNESKRYGLVLPAPRKLAGSESTSCELKLLEIVSVSVVTTAAEPSTVTWSLIWPTSSATLTRKVWRASKVRSLTRNDLNPAASVPTVYHPAFRLPASNWPTDSLG